MTAAGVEPGVRALLLRMGHDELRALSLATAYEEAASALLRDRHPGQRPLLLLQVAMTQAILSGDQALLAAAGEVIGRLCAFLPEDRPWRHELSAVLTTLAQTAALALEGLRSEYELAAEECEL